MESKLNLIGIRENGIKKAVQDKNAFDVTVELTEIDQMGKIADFTEPKVTQRVERTAYIKMVNVPTPLDIAGTTADPTDGSLSFSMLDFNTFLTFQHFLKQEKNPIQALIDADEPDLIENAAKDKADKFFLTPSQKLEAHLLAPNGGV